METEDVKSALSLLEEALKSDIVNIKQRKIKSDKIIDVANKKLNPIILYQQNHQFGGSLTSEHIRDSATVTQVMVPSEIFVAYKTDSAHSQSSNVHYNLAYSQGQSEKCTNSETERIINMRVKQ